MHRAILSHTHVAFALLGVLGTPQKCVLFTPLNHKQLPTTGGQAVFTYHLHETESVLALMYTRLGERLTWLLDPLANSTTYALNLIRSSGQLLVSHADVDQSKLPECVTVTDDCINDILEEVERHKETMPQSRFLPFRFRALHADVFAMHATHPHYPDFRIYDLPGSSSVTVLVGEEHLNGYSHNEADGRSTMPPIE